MEVENRRDGQEGVLGGIMDAVAADGMWAGFQRGTGLWTGPARFGLGNVLCGTVC